MKALLFGSTLKPLIVGISHGDTREQVAEFEATFSRQRSGTLLPC